MAAPGAVLRAGDEVIWETRAEAGAEAVLRELGRLLEVEASEPKQLFRDAGLVFTSDVAD